jgi:hypothetical protein
VEQMQVIDVEVELVDACCKYNGLALAALLCLKGAPPVLDRQDGM